MPRSLILFCLIACFATSCKKDVEDGVSRKESFDIRYKVTFQGAWNSTNHPIDFPQNARFSSGFILAHNAAMGLFELSFSPTISFQDFIKDKTYSPLENYGEEQINVGNALDYNYTISMDSEENTETYIGVSEEFNSVTFVVNLKPSTDWFAAVYNLNLFENGGWVDSKTVDVFPYDAGIYQGTTYEDSPVLESPVGLISLINTSPIVINGVYTPLGQVTFARQ